MWNLTSQDLKVLVVAIVTIAAGLVYLMAAIGVSLQAARCEQDDAAPSTSREERLRHAEQARGRPIALSRYAIALIAFVTGGCVLARLIDPTVAYAIVCCALVSNYAVDLISEERARRRRAALLQRSRGADPILVAWIVMAALSPGLLATYFAASPSRPALIAIIGCVLAMAAIAWRIATAPPLLLGDDLPAEQSVDRLTRTNRAGMVCTLALGTVFVATNFVAPPSGEHDGVVLAAFLAWSGTWAWQAIYSRHLSHRVLSAEAK